MSRTLSLHHEAMAFADLAQAAKRGGDSNAAQQYFRQAFELEAQAANSVASDLDAEPTRSILFRSAATLALSCGLLEEAITLVQQGLSGNPPYAIAEELRTVVDEAGLQRHFGTGDFARKLRAFFAERRWSVSTTASLCPRARHASTIQRRSNFRPNRAATFSLDSRTASMDIR